MSLYRVLVVDDDPWMHRIVATHLSGLSIKIDTADEGTTALAKALATCPDLIISDVMMPGMDGWSLVKEVRAHARLALIPFIFLTSLASAGDLLRGFRLGADDFLCKPFRGPELVERVLAALKRSERTVADAQARLVDNRGAGLRGTLQDTSLPALLTLLEMERKTGLLALTRKHPDERCRIFLRNGRVVAASSDLDRGLVHALAVFHALYWTEGSFSFSSVAIDVADAVGMSTTQLLIDGARRVDEALRTTLSAEARKSQRLS